MYKCVLLVLILVFYVNANEFITYDYTDHGMNWSIFRYCNMTKQSPIDLIQHPNQTINNQESYFFAQYKPTKANLTAYNTSFVISQLDTSQFFGTFYSVIPDGQQTKGIFNAYEVRFHTPAEHTFGGKRYDLEMQIYHKLDIKIGYAYKFAAVSVFFNLTSDATDLFLEDIINNYQQKNPDYTLDLSPFLNMEQSNQRSYYAYQGSLTIPQCYQYVNWYVMEQPYQIGQQQLKFFQDLFVNNSKFNGTGGNYRNIQTDHSSDIMNYYYKL